MFKVCIILLSYNWLIITEYNSLASVDNILWFENNSLIFLNFSDWALSAYFIENSIHWA